VTIKAAMLADSANQSMEGKANILGVFTQMRCDRVPVNHSSCTLVLILQTSMEDAGKQFPCKITWRGPDGEMVLEATFDLGIQGTLSIPPPQINLLHKIDGLPVQRFGPHVMEVTLDGNGESVARWDVDVRPYISANQVTINVN
jgi:hypothetical protein